MSNPNRPASLEDAVEKLSASCANYVKLSRYGLVLNRNVPYKDAEKAATAVREHDLKNCRKNRFLALGLARYMLRREPYGDKKKLQKLIQTLERKK